jgi:hypothetical protein
MESPASHRLILINSSDPASMAKPFCSLCGKLLPWVLFGALLVTGLCITRDYGTYIDEFTNHYFGVRWYDYAYNVLVKGAPLVLPATVTEHDVVHGPFIEMAFALLENKVIHLPDIREIVFFRHYGTWMIFYLSVICFYFLAKKLFARGWLALLASAFLVIHPRIFSHAFYDSVDIPLLSFYIFGLATLFRLLEKRTLGSLCLHAIVCGMLIDIRVIGAVIPGLTLVLLLVELIRPRDSADRLGRRFARIGIYSVLVTATTVAFWPYLWANPLMRVLDVIRQTPKVAWDGSVLYMGDFIKANNLPWHYIPVWIAITTPIAYTVFFVIGLAGGLGAFLSNSRRFYRQRLHELVVMAAVLLPVLAVILSKAVIFDSWRHLFFIYPAFVLVSIAGIKQSGREIDAHFKGRARVGLHGAIGLFVAGNILMAGWFMIKNHPYENVYFNRLAGRSMAQIKDRFDLDYWGLSYRNALEYVVDHDPDKIIRVCDAMKVLPLINTIMLAPADRARVQPVGFGEAKYVFTTFRGLKAGYPSLQEYFSIKVGGERIVCVYKKEPGGAAK